MYTIHNTDPFCKPCNVLNSQKHNIPYIEFTINLEVYVLFFKQRKFLSFSLEYCLNAVYNMKAIKWQLSQVTTTISY